MGDVAFADLGGVWVLLRTRSSLTGSCALLIFGAPWATFGPRSIAPARSRSSDHSMSFGPEHEALIRRKVGIKTLNNELEMPGPGAALYAQHHRNRDDQQSLVTDRLPARHIRPGLNMGRRRGH
jgi:hypothetical protein